MSPKDIAPNRKIEFSLPDVFKWGLWSSPYFGDFRVYVDRYTVLFTSGYRYYPTEKLDLEFYNYFLGKDIKIEFLHNVIENDANWAKIKFMNIRPNYMKQVLIKEAKNAQKYVVNKLVEMLRKYEENVPEYEIKQGFKEIMEYLRKNNPTLFKLTYIWLKKSPDGKLFRYLPYVGGYFDAIFDICCAMDTSL